MELVPKLHITVFFIRNSENGVLGWVLDLDEDMWCETFDSMQKARRFVFQNKSAWEWYFVNGSL